MAAFENVRVCIDDRHPWDFDLKGVGFYLKNLNEGILLCSPVI